MRRTQTFRRSIAPLQFIRQAPRRNIFPHRLNNWDFPLGSGGGWDWGEGAEGGLGGRFSSIAELQGCNSRLDFALRK